MPGEQFPERGVITARHGGDQLVVIHCFSIALRRHPVRPAAKFPADARQPSVHLEQRELNAPGCWPARGAVATPACAADPAARDVRMRREPGKGRMTTLGRVCHLLSRGRVVDQRCGHDPIFKEGVAADGLSNRQIAQHLFITQPAVESHLQHAFQKLGITSRAGLPSQLAVEVVRPAGVSA